MRAIDYFDTYYPQVFDRFDLCVNTFSEFYFTVVYVREFGHTLPHQGSPFIYGGILQTVCHSQAECIADIGGLTMRFNNPRNVDNVVIVGYLYQRGNILPVMGHAI